MMEPLRLLMVEDSEDDAEIIRLELERAGFALDWRRVDTEEDFVTALDESWDLILSDFQMPQFDGLRAFALYQRHGSDTPFIFVSGALGEERAVEAMRLGARDYLLKGNLARLSAAVKRELADASNRVARQRAQDAARSEQRRLAMAVEASGAGVFEHAVPPGPDSYQSERWAEIFGLGPRELPAPELFTTWLFDRAHPDDRRLLEHAYERLVEGEADRCDVELRMQHAEGRWVDVAVFAKAVEGRVVGVILDLTQRSKLEAELRHAQKMEAIGRLAGGVAHDFNNLLTAIFSFGSFVLDELSEQAIAYEDMQEVLKAARKAESLTSQLLAFSRRRPVAPEVLNINTLVEDTDRMLRRVVGEDVDVVTTLAGDLWNVRVDAGSLEQVLVNLAVNARDAMPDGGSVTVETANASFDEGYQRDHDAQMPPGDYVVVAVADNGSGMDQETQRHIFEPFYTTKPVGKGTGFGLSTCYGIIKQAGGYIWVDSEPGIGTTLEIYLPRVHQDVQERASPRVVADHRGTEAVLVAEDDDQVRKLIARTLTQLGYRVFEAANGREASRWFEQSTRSIDLLLTDVVMPEMSGKDLVDSISGRRPGMKVLYMSGYTPDAIVHQGVLEPGTHLLQKPFTPSALASKVREMLDE